MGPAEEYSAQTTVLRPGLPMAHSAIAPAALRSSSIFLPFFPLVTTPSKSELPPICTFPM